MKLKRLTATMLALLLVVSLLPMTALAEETVNSDNNVKLDKDYDYNIGDNVTVPENITVGINQGSITTVEKGGTVDVNVHFIGNSGGPIDEKAGNFGTVNKNYNSITVNHNQVGTNASNSIIVFNRGEVGTNEDAGYIYTNSGIIGTNNGNVGAIVDSDSGNSGTITTNGGDVRINQKDGTVEHNNPEGTVEYNYGLVGKVVDGKLDTTGNYGNSGRVENNQQGGVVVNNEGGYVSDNHSNGDGTNPGIINNGGKVNVNNGTMDNFAGQVYWNNEGGKILNNYGTVGVRPMATSKPDQFNYGTVETNHISGWVTNNITGENEHGEGKVNTNYGTVYQADKSNTWIYYYGLHGEDEDTDTMYTVKDYSLGHEAGAEVNLDEKAASYQREGHKLSSYTVWTYNKDSDATDKLEKQDVADRTKYTINAPTLLKLTWEKIASIFTSAASTASSGGGAEAVPTSYNPKYIGLGSVKTINGSRFKVVEIKDDAFVVVSFDALSDEDVQDLDALYAKLFTAEQQKQIRNVGQLLDAEDVLAIFGKPGNHPVFEISKDLLK